MNMIAPLAQYMNIITATLAEECNEGLRGTDVRGVQLFYLLCVCQHPGSTQEELAAHLGVNGSNVTRQLTELETAGYIVRRICPGDRRSRLVEPTDRAYEILPRLVEIMNDARAALCRGMSAEEQELLLELSQKMARNADLRRARRT